MARKRKARKANVPTTQRLLAMVKKAKTGTDRQRLAAVTACFLTQSFPVKFKFDMSTFSNGGKALQAMLTVDMKRLKPHHHTCGTVGCIAGLTNFLFTEKVPRYSEGFAGDLLGLGSYDQNEIFMPTIESNGDSGYEDVSKHPVQVGRVLTHFMRTGQIDWSVKRRLMPVTVAGRRF